MHEIGIHDYEIAWISSFYDRIMIWGFILIFWIIEKREYSQNLFIPPPPPGGGGGVLAV